jgi:putative ABC transport system permease protein
MAEFEIKLTEFIRPPDIGHEKDRDVYFSQPLGRMHFGAGLRTEIGQTNAIIYIRMLTAAAALILLLACLNYTTLATARATRRLREIGLRKVIGAGRMSLIKQFLGESLVFSLLAFVIAVLCVELLLPLFNQLMNRDLEFSLISHLPIFLIISLLVGCVAGFYPAVYLSSFQPTQIFRGKGYKDAKPSSVLHKSLVLTQFVITIALLICILIVKDQIRFIVESSTQEFEDPIVTVNLNDGDLRENYEALLQAYKHHPQVLDSTVSYSHPLRIAWGMGLKWEGIEKEQFVRVGPIDFNYIDFYGLKVIKGRKLLGEMSMDKSDAVLLNESAAKASPWDDPIGKRCSFDGHEGIIVGIVEDFHFQPLYNSVEGLALRHIYQGGVAGGAGFISLKISSFNIPGTIKFLEDTWNTFSAYFPFQYAFLDETIDRIYRTEIRLRRSLTFFTGVAVFLACLGLFGLTSFTAESRTKEIGIRKVLGASSPTILLMLSKEIFIWIGLASVAAFPIAYFTMHEWLQRFVYRIEIGWMTFLLATALSLGISILAMSFQSIKAAAANPIDSLRYE